MTRYDQRTADCFVFTFKEGLLSPVAHDLRLRVNEFELELDEQAESVVASFDTSSLQVDAPMKDGVDNPTALSAGDRSKIAAQIREEVLHSSRFPRCHFRSRSLSQRADGTYDVSGDLTLHGVTQRVAAQTRLAGGEQQLELTLHQPDYGITPFRAMLGTLKIQANVVVRLTLRAS